MAQRIKEFIATILIGLFFGFCIVECMDRQEQLIEKHCSGLSGYEYGQCQAGIY